jgi:hypothetical protein
MNTVVTTLPITIQDMATHLFTFHNVGTMLRYCRNVLDLSVLNSENPEKVTLNNTKE